MILTFIGLCVICVTAFACVAFVTNAWVKVTKLENRLNGATIITGDTVQPDTNDANKQKLKDPEPNFGDVIAEINKEFGGINNGEEFRL